MQKAIIGAGGFAREVKAHMGDKTIKCFVDDQYYSLNDDTILPISKFDPNEYEVIVAIGDPKTRYNIVKRLPKETKYFTFIHPTAIILGDDVYIGDGSIICAGVIITTNISIGKHSQLNLQTTIGHDCRIGDYFTTAPGAKISGNCTIGDFVYFGTNSSVKEKINICNNVTIGLGAGVTKNIIDSGVYIGCPANKK